MLKFYSIAYKTYHNDTYIDTHYGKTLAEEGTVKDEIIQIDWDNLSEMYQKYSLALPFNIWNFKKGRLVSFFVGNPFKKDFRDIREWKTKYLDVDIHIEYTDVSSSISIEDVLKWHDAEKAIQYLNERNLKLTKG
jgi:hypothetical protein